MRRYFRKIYVLNISNFWIHSFKYLMPITTTDCTDKRIRNFYKKFCNAFLWFILFQRTIFFLTLSLKIFIADVLVIKTNWISRIKFDFLKIRHVTTTSPNSLGTLKTPLRQNVSVNHAPLPENINNPIQPQKVFLSTIQKKVLCAEGDLIFIQLLIGNYLRA